MQQEEVASIRIAPVDERTLAALAQVYVDAFATEGINSHMFDLSRGNASQARLKAPLLEFDSLVRDSSHLLAAVKGDVVVGGAALTPSDVRSTLSVRARRRLRVAAVALPLVPAIRWRRIPAVGKAVRLSQPITDPHYIFTGLMVHPDFQGQGIGKLLLQEVHRISDADHDRTGVYLYTADEKNRILYERAGYETIEERRAGALTVWHMFRPRGVTRGML